MKMLLLALGVASAFVPPASMQTVSRVVATSDISMMAQRRGLFGQGPASPTKPTVTKKAKPLSAGSNYPTTKNIQTQSNGFGTWVQKFEVASSTKKSKYGVPTFLPNGNVNPAYLAAE